MNSFSSGGYHCIRLGEDGTAYSWGYKYFGQLGLGVINGSTASMVLPSPNNDYKWTSFGCGNLHFFLDSSKMERFIVGNMSGELGLGINGNRNKPKLLKCPDESE